ncbi:hypothetical protein CIB95_02615 [Lottiidibacillus patelloidae]|uniref:Lipoprotein n=1 Tax=Lottiidibacillus patelloidae TaxID=2670334 RepID=A0A263BXM1_9BACI|nr:hypothetical protein [Lottiidibacillus patelloidae]OZM58479.1 hypothetical protein CIB95_02615 [Lottiidibacillus patelloidae]
MKFLMLIMMNVLLLVGCSLHNNDKVDEIIEKISVVPIDVNEPDTVEAVAKNEKRSLSIKHEVKGHDVYIECYVPNFHFSKENVGKRNKDGEGHIHLYLNGEKITKIYKAAFIVKGLPSGKHKLKIEIAHNNHTPYDKLYEELEVKIP